MRFLFFSRLFLVTLKFVLNNPPGSALIYNTRKTFQLRISPPSRFMNFTRNLQCNETFYYPTFSYTQIHTSIHGFMPPTPIYSVTTKIRWRFSQFRPCTNIWEKIIGIFLILMVVRRSILFLSIVS